MKQEKTINLALQGGGSHGAFTWGVLERLLEEEDLSIEGICGTSSGAMNATLMIYGLHTGGRERAQQLLREFWKKLSQNNSLGLLDSPWMRWWQGHKGNLDFSPTYWLSKIGPFFMSPYMFNPLAINPLKEVLEELIDFEELQGFSHRRLFVSATNVKTGRARIFEGKEIVLDCLLASACLPQANQAIQIGDDFYWDGGFMGNPPLYPLIYNTSSQDILLVQVNPIHIPEVPQSPEAIQDRVSELSFNSSLMIELRAIQYLNELKQAGYDCDGRIREVYIHSINPEKDLWDLNDSSRLNVSWDFLDNLRSWGYRYAEEWLEAHKSLVGKVSSCDVRARFM